MNFSDLIADRFSVRSYQTKKVEEDKLDIILEAARVAPSAGNKRPVKLIVVQSEDGLNKAKKTTDTHDAPLLIIVCGNLQEAAVRNFDGKKSPEVDASIVIDHMMLQASDLGFGTLWIGQFDPKVIQSDFNIPKHIEPIGILAIGYSAEKQLSREEHAKKYKPLNELVAYETFPLTQSL